MEELRGEIDAFANHRLRLLLHAQAESDVVEELQMRKHGVALEDHRDPAAARRQVGRIAASDEHAPAVDLLEAGEAAKQRRLAAAGRSEQHDEVAVGDLEVDVVDRGHLAEGLANRVEANVGHYFNTLPHIENR